MKTYKVTYIEKLIHTFYVEAENEEEAERVFEEGCMNSMFDFSDGEVDSTDYWVDEDDDKYHHHYYPSDEEYEIDRLYHDASEDELRKMGVFDNLNNDDEYVPSSENGDYSPSNPWDAPGMSISDFI
jgi:antitoxin component YwqK of YwqJK toxin-antitoxin module